MPYYSELGIYTSPTSTYSGGYIPGPYANHSSLIVARPLLKTIPRNFRGYKPLLNTISESQSPLRRLNAPSLRPIKKINTADIDVSLNKYRKYGRSKPEDRTKSPSPKEEKDAKPNAIIRRDRATIRIQTIHNDNEGRRWRDNFHPHELRTTDEEKRPRKTPGELLKEKFLIKEELETRQEAKSVVRTPSFHDICTAITSNQINEELNPGQPIEIQRRQSRQCSVEDIVALVELQKSHEAGAKGKCRRKSVRKKSNESVVLKDCDMNKSGIQRRTTQKKIRRPSAELVVDEDVQKEYQEAIRDISQVEIESVPKRRPKPIFTATIDVDEKRALKPVANLVEVVESPKSVTKSGKFKFNVIVEDVVEPKVKASLVRGKEEGKGILPQAKPFAITSILKKRQHGQLGQVLEESGEKVGKVEEKKKVVLVGGNEKAKISGTKLKQDIKTEEVKKKPEEVETVVVKKGQNFFLNKAEDKLKLVQKAKEEKIQEIKKLEAAKNSFCNKTDEVEKVEVLPRSKNEMPKASNDEKIKNEINTNTSGATINNLSNKTDEVMAKVLIKSKIDVQTNEEQKIKDIKKMEVLKTDEINKTEIVTKSEIESSEKPKTDEESKEELNQDIRNVETNIVEKTDEVKKIDVLTKPKTDEESKEELNQDVRKVETNIVEKTYDVKKIDVLTKPKIDVAKKPKSEEKNEDIRKLVGNTDEIKKTEILIKPKTDIPKRPKSEENNIDIKKLEADEEKKSEQKNEDIRKFETKPVGKTDEVKKTEVSTKTKIDIPKCEEKNIDIKKLEAIEEKKSEQKNQDIRKFETKLVGKTDEVKKTEVFTKPKIDIPKRPKSEEKNDDIKKLETNLLKESDEVNKTKENNVEMVKIQVAPIKNKLTETKQNKEPDSEIAENVVREESIVKISQEEETIPKITPEPPKSKFPQKPEKTTKPKSLPESQTTEKTLPSPTSKQAKPKKTPPPSPTSKTSPETVIDKIPATPSKPKINQPDEKISKPDKQSIKTNSIKDTNNNNTSSNRQIENTSNTENFWDEIGPRNSVYRKAPKPSDAEQTKAPMPSKRSLVAKANRDDPDLEVFVVPEPEPDPEPEVKSDVFVPLQSNRLSAFMHPFQKPEQFEECPVEIFARPKTIRKRHYPRPRGHPAVPPPPPVPVVEPEEEESESEESSEEESTETSSTGSSEEEDDEYDINVVYGNKIGASTSSNDSGFDSGVPGSRNKDCDVNCHKKCEKLTANLCGVNQKLIVEAIESVRKGTHETRDSQAALSANNPAFALDSESLEEYSQSSTFVGFQKSGRITPPATTIPRFRKYCVEDFNFLKVLGKGSFGKVLLAELKDTEYYYAIKCLKKDVVLEDDDVECTLIERKVLALGTKHPYLCHLLCTFQTESHLFFVMEYLNGGDLMFHIQKSGRFPEDQARFYGAEIVSGLKFLHNKGIVYRDLKLDNILLDFDGHVRIADFGMCKLQIFLDRMADTFCGTPDYMAPEIIKGLHYNQCVDWWSFGVLLYEMLIGQSPFSGCDEDELFWSICNEKPVIPRFLSTDASAIVLQLLEKDGNKRMGYRFCPEGDIQDQPFFKRIQWDLLEARQLESPFKPNLQHPLDTQYFDKTFTVEKAKLTPIETTILQSMDQTQFQGFSYTNPNATDK